MEKLKLKYQSAEQALKTLKTTLENIDKAETIKIIEGISREELLKTLRDSAIQRFEYSIDTLWKYLKVYLLHTEGIEQTHPKPIFRECFNSGWLSSDETQLALQMVDSRNSTSHAYNENVAKKVLSSLKHYSDLMQKLLDKTTPST
jgi:nucleotidyltransferase substrate binding protein (TIGR01987 family)